MIKTFPFRLDIEKEYNNRMYSVNSNDLKTVKFTFVVTDNGIPLDLTGLTVRIAIRKPDKKAVWQDCTVINAPKGEVEVILDNQAYIKKGEHEAELMLYKETDTVAITQKFHYRAAEGIMSDKSLKSETVLGPIDQKLAEVEETIKDIRDNGTGIDAKARQDIQSVTTQLAEKASVIEASKTYKQSTVTKKTFATFIDDNGHNLVWDYLKPITEETGVPFVLALNAKSTTVYSPDIGPRISDERALYLQNTLGYEIASHGYSHVDMHLLKNEKDRIREVVDIKTELLNRGFNVNNIVYPYGESGEDIRRIAAKHYNAGTTTVGGHNTFPVKNFELMRYALGSIDPTSTLEETKKRINRAVADNGWIIFMLHVGYPDHNAESNQLIRDTIAYLKSLNVEIGTLQQGWEMFGNQTEIKSQNSFLAVSNDGQIGRLIDGFKTQDIVQVDKTKYTLTTLPNKYPDKQITVAKYVSSDSSGFPGGGAGIAITHRVDGTDMIYQEFYPVFSSTIYRRSAGASGSSWNAWMEIGPQAARRTGVSPATTPPANFELGTTIFSTTAQSEGYPTTGIVMVMKSSDSATWTQQLLFAQATGETYKRISKSDGTWGEWVLINNTQIILPPTSGITADALPTSYFNGKSVHFVNTTMGFPVNGYLETYYRSGNNARQVLYAVANTDIHTRNSNAGGTAWNSWVVK